MNSTNVPADLASCTDIRLKIRVKRRNSFQTRQFEKSLMAVVKSAIVLCPRNDSTKGNIRMDITLQFESISPGLALMIQSVKHAEVEKMSRFLMAKHSSRRYILII